MRFDSTHWVWRACFASLLACSLVIAAPAALVAQDKTAEAKTDDDDQDKEAKEDPFAVPEDASVEELLAWIEKTKRTPPGRNRVETAKKLFPAIIKACDMVLEKSDSEADQQKALEEEFSAYAILVRFEPSAQEKFDALCKKYSEDKRPAIAQIAVGQLLMSKSADLRGASAEQAQSVADEAVAFLERFGASRATYSPVSRIASSIGYTEHAEIAASLYESLAKLLVEAKDADISKRGEKMVGAARRLRLLGNEMTLEGLTAEGDAFDWSSYRGKVVLVDFWASWCGPCMAELPNMKKNLELYGDKGFAIVGINMDSTRAAFEKCVKDKELTWVNIVSEEEGKTGWDAPIANYYGISGIPTAILVDQEGKVVSLRARGGELDKLLEELLGEKEEDK